MSTTASFVMEEVRSSMRRMSKVELRNFVLVHSKGLSPAMDMVQEDGSVRSKADLCEKLEYQVLRYRGKKGCVMACANLLMDQEAAMPVLASSEATLQVLARFDHSSPAAFRRDLMATNGRLSVGSIHVFHWDGTNRSVVEMKRAFCIYPYADSGQMEAIFYRGVAGLQPRKVMPQPVVIKTLIRNTNAVRPTFEKYVHAFHRAMDRLHLDEKAITKHFTPDKCTGMERILQSLQIGLAPYVDMRTAGLWFADIVVTSWLHEKSQNPTTYMPHETAEKLYTMMKQEIAATILLQAYA